MFATNLKTVVLNGNIVADCNGTGLARWVYQVASMQEPAVVLSKRLHSSKPGQPSCHASTPPATGSLPAIALRDQRSWQTPRRDSMRAIDAMAFMGGRAASCQGQ
jgi:hypothetical protein